MSAVRPRILAEATFQLYDSPGDSLERFLQALDQQLLADLSPISRRDHHRSDGLLTVTAAIADDGDPTALEYGFHAPSRLAGEVQHLAQISGVPIKPLSQRRSAFRIATWTGHVRLNETIDFTKLEWVGSTPGHAQYLIYPGAELLATERRAQIWVDENFNSSNRGLAQFAMFDAYLVTGTDGSTQVWVSAGQCAELPVTDARVLPS